MAENKGGRPRIELTGEQIELIEKLAVCGLTQEEIASVLPISERTLSRRVTEGDSEVMAVYARGRAVWKRQLTTRHRDICLGKHADEESAVPWKERRQAIEFRLKTEFGYANTENLNLRTPDGIQVEDARGKLEKQLEGMGGRLAALASANGANGAPSNGNGAKGG